MFDEHETTPFATGGFSEVYEATLEGRCVAVKVLKITDAETIESVRKVDSPLLPLPNGSLTLGPKLLVKEVVGWKWLRHENILPFVGVSLKPSLFSIISERMENGNIMGFIKARPNHNRMRLVSEGKRFIVQQCRLFGHSSQAQWLAWNTYTSTASSMGTSRE